MSLYSNPPPLVRERDRKRDLRVSASLSLIPITNMAEESSIATSSATPNWWPDLHANSLSSWSSNSNPWHPQNPNSNSSGEEDLSISNQSGLSVDSSRHLVESAPANDFIGETASDNQLWSHVLFAGSRGELNNSIEIGDNSINMLSSKSLSIGMFEPACDYLKKMDTSWEFTNQPSLNNFEKHYNGFNESLIESERLTKLSNLVNNWSIAPPDSRINHPFDSQSCNISLSSTMDRFSPSDLCHMKQRVSNSDLYSGYGHEMKVKDEYQIGLNNSLVGNNNKYYYGVAEVPYTSTRSFADVMSFNSILSKPSMDVHASKPLLKSLNLSDSKKQGVQTSSHGTISTCHTVSRSNIRGHGISSEGKKKRSEEINSETALKKPKHETSALSSSKLQIPKVKLGVGDKITALQQIVSPFGKTDTASVLGETIGYIKYLQEQVQLLSNPYTKTNVNKDPWGGLDRKDRGGDIMFDLKSRGLCLVPISCTPQAYRDNSGSDYWSTPTYRGCLYR
ncbi:transcription factor bHLH111 isoform X2 [Actinidia eriantha]|uniref:transcription factor bHLH111 isoform X2 n=1 Tax=Actinidia eriantha TaxID=165200 RepID=UPI0025872FCA|nr:transcription factor bHLH111 isoform X2 [Actinidia eriantha]